MLNSLFIFSQEDARFRIVENNKIGYINNKGQVVIKPIFNNGSDFTDGLAAVRENGLYGFIDIYGNYILKPQYDYASPFYEDYGVVYKEGKKQIINKKGEIAIPSAFKDIISISNDKAIVFTSSRKRGVIDLKTKKLLVDTIYSSIEPFYKGLSIVKSFNEKKQTYIIDTLGRIVVQPGLYSEINSFSKDDIAIVTLADHDSNDDDNSIQGAIDLEGKLLFTYENKYSKIRGDFSNGLAEVSDYYWKTKPENAIYHRGYINTKGKIVYDDHTIESVKPFFNNRAFIYNGKNNILIDQNFNKIGDSLYNRIFSENDMQEVFIDNYAIVQSSEFNWGVIDTTGHYIIKPKFDEINHFKNGLIFFTEYDNEQNPHYGICNINGEIIYKPIIDIFDNRGLVDGLLRLIIDNELTYIDRQGNIIWQQKKSLTKEIKYLNIDFMNRGYCYAYSETEKNNGWAMSDNFPKKIKNIKFPKKQLSLVIDKNNQTVFNDEFYGCKLYLANTTGKKIELNASDSRLNILLQAVNNKGNWEYIEYAPTSWCGNSYHDLYLDSGEYWDFTIPMYEGSIKTKVRAVLKYYENNSEKFIYSNPIELSVNPAQFFNKLQYYRNNLMDSYDD